MASVKVLVVVTNHNQLGSTDKKTGWYLPEVAHPVAEFKTAGFQVVFGSPKGGEAPVDPSSVDAFKEDPICKAFMAKGIEELKATAAVDKLNASDFHAVFFAGGHGPMWDVTDCEASQNIARKVYEAGGVIGAVCHGTCGLLRLTDIIKNRKVTGFTDAEEAAVGLTAVMPFLLETELKKTGANFVAAADWSENCQVDARIVTGQNPASATKCGAEIVKLLTK